MFPHLCSPRFTSSRIARPGGSARAFSLVELIIVIVIIGILAAIAVPRASNAAETAKANAFVATVKSLQSAIDFYTAEHADRGPATGISGSIDASAANFVQRIVRTTDLDGDTAGSVYGPYLQQWPTNSLNGKKTVRIDGAPVSANTHGWRFDTPSGTIQADHRTVDISPTLAAIIVKGLRQAGVTDSAAGGVTILSGNSR